MKFNRKIWFHFLALATVCIWGVTCISTKILMQYGLTPIEIFMYRSTIAWVCMVAIAPKKLFANGWRDELWLVLAGFMGGTCYFVSENYALSYTIVANVALISCVIPLITALISTLIWPEEKPTRILIIGSIIAFCGVALVVFNGNVILQLSPLGDMLAVAAAFSWVSYCLILRHLGNRYSISFITRKVFFYGCLTLIPFVYLKPWPVKLEVLIQLPVICNLLFLSIVASMLCFLMWNQAMTGLGPVGATNYIYMVPIVGMLTSAIVLGEPINLVMILGSVLILFGVFIGQRKKSQNEKLEGDKHGC